MAQGIAIIGLNGSGKSTLNHMLSRALGYFEMDVEDYYFPHQRTQRLQALDGAAGSSAEEAYTREQPQEEVQAALLQDMAAHPRFVFSCVRMGWSSELLSHIGLAFWLQVPLEVRMQRIAQREEHRFGKRVLPGGDMYERQQSFHQLVARRDPASVAESIARLTCPVVELDGTLPPEENLRIILAHLQQKTGCV